MDDAERYLSDISNGKKIRPILLEKLPEDKYHIVDGHRRFWAYKKKGFIQIPAIVRNIFFDMNKPLHVFLNSEEEELIKNYMEK